MSACSSDADSISLTDWLRIAPASAAVAGLIVLVVVWLVLRKRK